MKLKFRKNKPGFSSIGHATEKRCRECNSVLGRFGKNKM